MRSPYLAGDGSAALYRSTSLNSRLRKFPLL
jgi:hypothetical protein